MDALLVVDAEPADSGIVDTGDTSMNDQTITDAFVTVDMETDMVIEDSFIDTPTDSMLPPASCVNQPERTCNAICSEPLFVSSEMAVSASGKMIETFARSL